MTAPVVDIDRGWKAIMREMTLQQRSDLVVDVGIIGTEAEQPHSEGGKLTNADIGLFHEYGTTGMSLGRSGAESGATPERSFLRSTMDESHGAITRLFERVVRGAIEQRINLRRGLNLIGERAVSWVKARIRKGIPPPLMPSTIDRKGSSKPLIDKGQLIGSITYAVRGVDEGDISHAV
jgi:hypothetical protein